MGALFSTILLMTGSSFVLGGIGREHQAFNTEAVRTSTALNISGTICITITTFFRFWVEPADEVPDLVGTDRLSRATDALSIILYIGVLIFEQRTLPRIVGEPSRMPAGSTGHQSTGGAARFIRRVHRILDRRASYIIQDGSSHVLSRTVSIAVLVVSTTLLGFHVEFSTNALQDMAYSKASQSFISVVLLPLLSTDPGPVIAAIENNMDLAMATTLSKSVQTQMLVMPLLVLIAAAIGVDEFNYSFDAQWMLSLIASVIVLSYITSNGKTNWLVPKVHY